MHYVFNKPKDEVSKMSVEENKALVRRLIEECRNKKNLDVLGEIMAPNWVTHGPGGDKENNLEQSRKGVSEIFDAAPDLHDEIIDIVAEGDRVAVLYNRHQTFKNQYHDIAPTGEKASIWIFNLFRIADGKIVETWSVFDTVAFQKFLGTYGK